MATIKDIANAAGVSVATVSHVVNNTRFVSPELRKRVEEGLQMQKPPNFVVKRKCRKKERKKKDADGGAESNCSRCRTGVLSLSYIISFLPTLTVLLNRNYVNWQGSRDVNWFV